MVCTPSFTGKPSGSFIEMNDVSFCKCLFVGAITWNNGNKSLTLRGNDLLIHTVPCTTMVMLVMTTEMIMVTAMDQEGDADSDGNGDGHGHGHSHDHGHG